MKQHVKHHLIAYAILILGLILAAGAYVYVWPNHQLMRLVALVMVGFYFIWGVSTHVKTRHITTRVVYEYATVSLLAGLALILVTL